MDPSSGEIEPAQLEMTLMGQSPPRENEKSPLPGYLHPDYARSLAEFGMPRNLPRSGGWVLERAIEGVPYRDAMGCYPIFACRDWSQLHADLAEIGDDLISLTLVTDPFGEYTEDTLQRCFPDKCVPFKDHYVTDLSQPRNQTVSKHHRYYARKSLEQVRVEICEDHAQFLDPWIELYSTLVERHNIQGIQAFSREAFALQLTIPGLVILRAEAQGRTMGAHLWYIQGDVAHSHLAAFSPLGYDLMASYALYWSAIEHFAGKTQWLSLGAGAGLKEDATDGLSRFKRGWATGTRVVYLCGRVFDRTRYRRIVEARSISDADYFPAYRAGEFG